MRSSLVATRGLKLVRSRSLREEASRRRWAVAAAAAALALASGLVGYLTTPSGSADAGRTGPFSYFPSE
jgi:hypothetical protein